MPTYQYRCSSCSHELEAFQSMNDEPLTVCPECGAEQLKRVISAGGGFMLKGSGFYNTDYKNASKSQAAAPPCACANGACNL
ncbi:regulatory protein, FmdB family [Chloroherpeton thalassium ATCC 35110]|uniref:Regulatory protein, FmdB family n=1 Tax=Chloroherpeton thalassium (strain ATCC 35110 / GB-78) TaxID=517418 RepID=B3QUI9_CHLT3|nr:zinc ribbon domain-containing protein [Chloroherpeton thalassium]ACF12895.1 regulatory protein, FmdB family [Chloroherpeton thalassium ATCC 35110]